MADERVTEERIAWMTARNRGQRRSNALRHEMGFPAFKRLDLRSSVRRSKVLSHVSVKVASARLRRLPFRATLMREAKR
jgi:hypothetical protein